MRIGDLAAATGVSARSLRYYEEQGLLSSSRSASGQRHYEESAVERVRLLQLLFSAGLSSSTIRELLPCVDHPSRETSRTAFERMEQERELLSERIAELIRTRDTLDKLIESNRRSVHAAIESVSDR